MYYSRKEAAAAYLSTSEQTIRGYIISGKLLFDKYLI